MTSDETQAGKRAVDDILKGVAKKTSLLVFLASAGVLVNGLVRHSAEPWWFLPASILFGGLLGFLNFRWLSIAVQRIYLRQGATQAGSQLAAMIISILKLSLIFIILFFIIKWRMLQVFGLVAGLSLCFLSILWEGATMMKRTHISGVK